MPRRWTRIGMAAAVGVVAAAVGLQPVRAANEVAPTVTGSAPDLEITATCDSDIFEGAVAEVRNQAQEQRTVLFDHDNDGNVDDTIPMPHGLVETLQRKDVGDQVRVHIANLEPLQQVVIDFTPCDPSAEPCTEAPFEDVAADHPFCAEIAWASEAGITTGYFGGPFGPTFPVTRQAAAVFLARFADAELAEECTEAPFTDVPVEHPFCKEITWAADADITSGYDDGTFRPGTPVSRQAMAAFLARAAEINPSTCLEAPFSDVPVEHPFCNEISWAADAGITNGFDDGTYQPAASVSRQAAAAFLFRLSTILNPPPE